MNKIVLASAIAVALSSPVLNAETSSETSVDSTPIKKPLFAVDTSQWKGSLIIEGIYYNSNTSHHEDHDEDEHEEEEGHEEEEHNDHGGIAGFPQGAHGHGFREGLHTGHIEAVVSGNLSDKLHTRTTVGILETEEGLEMELEEAYVETQGLGNGIGIKAGRFMSDLGYLSAKHNHEWDFADNALIYKGLFGAHTYDDGMQFSYLAPTDLYLQLGTELFKGDDFPAANSGNTVGAGTIFAKLGGDIGTDHSWLLGLGHWRASDINGRTGDAHLHEEDVPEVTPSFDIDSKINAINLVYKWAPNGNSKQRNFKFQTEYLQRDESGKLTMLNADGSTRSAFDYGGEQSGWYAQGIYQFRPQWRVGMRYGELDSDNKLAGIADDHHVYEVSNLGDDGITPKRTSLMLDYSPREYSRWRLQYNRDETTDEKDDQFFVQFIHSLGSHGAHAF